MDLQQGIQTLELSLDPYQIEQLEGLLDGVEKWNRVYNLTRITQRSQMVILHVLDSLALAPALTDAPLLDVGSGAGFPGLPLAIARPYQDIVLLDSAQKRTRFTTQMKGQLGLENLSVVTDRVELYRPGYTFDQITARAFAPLPDLVTWVQGLLSPGGKILAMKGQYPNEEIAKTRELFPQAQVDFSVLEVPGLDAERHLIEVQF